MSKWYVLEGDYGGCIYCTVPVRLTSARRVLAALLIIDSIEWDCNAGEGLNASEVEGQLGEGVWGGMGGGLLTRSVWVHDSLAPELASWVRRFLLGELSLPIIGDMANWFYSDMWNLNRYANDWRRVRRRMRRAYGRAGQLLQAESSSNLATEVGDN